MTPAPEGNQPIRAARLLSGSVVAGVLAVALVTVSFWTATPQAAANATSHPIASQSPALAYRDCAARPSPIQASTAITTYTYLPLISRADVCQPIAGEQYNAIWVKPPPTDRPADVHADLNLSLRSYSLTGGYKGLIDLGGSTDAGAPQLPGLFADNRTPSFRSVYQVYDWTWATNSRGNAITSPAVTLAGLGTSRGEIIRVPPSGYNIGTKLSIPERGVALGSGGYSVLVLYTAADRITLKYTREDNVVAGYTLHLENLCVEPSLLALYESWNSAGRASLPALNSGQGVGRATGEEIGVAIRDCGTFMDPRSRKDWWQGR